MKSFHLTVAKVGETVFAGEAVSVTVPGALGTLTVLANHEPLVSALSAGVVRIQDTEGEKHEVEISEGTLEVSGNQVTVLL